MIRLETDSTPHPRPDRELMRDVRAVLFDDLLRACDDAIGRGNGLLYAEPVRRRLMRALDELRGEK